MKPRISQLAQSGAADGQAITWDETLGEWVPASTDKSHTLSFSRGGALIAGVGTHRLYASRALTILSVRASVGTSPTGSAVIVDVNINGATIFTTQANRPTVPDAGNTDLANAIDVTALAAGGYLTVDIDQVGSIAAGNDLTVQIEVI